MKTTQNRPYRGHLHRAALIGGWLLSAGVISAPALAEEAKLGGVTFWATATEGPESVAAIGPSLLRPPASWSWDTATPKLDFATGVEHRFVSGLSLDAGLSMAHATEDTSSTINYRDYFLGMSYGALDTKVWYLPESSTGEPSAVYYEAGWQQPVSEKVSLSVRLGQYGQSNYANAGYNDTAPSLSLGASTTMGGYGLGLRVIDGGGQMFGGEQDLRLMGSISKPLR